VFTGVEKNTTRKLGDMWFGNKTKTQFFREMLDIGIMVVVAFFAGCWFVSVDYIRTGAIFVPNTTSLLMFGMFIAIILYIIFIIGEMIYKIATRNG
jgi:hypothetical protein